MDTAYLTLWRMQKSVDTSVPWERDASAAIPMAIPILLLAESATRYLERRTGLGSLASLASNRIVYAVMIFVPVWLIVYIGFKSVNRRQPPGNRLGVLLATSTARYQWTCLVAYFLIPTSIFVKMFFF